MMKWLKRIFGRAPERTLRQYATITEEDLLARLLHAPESPLYQAFLVVVDEETVDLQNAALEEGLSEGTLRERLGGVRALAELKAALQERIEAARDLERQKEPKQV